jgi:hypothetical protein
MPGLQIKQFPKLIAPLGLERCSAGKNCASSPDSPLRTGFMRRYISA